jgi:hypothetical protein
MTGRQIFLRLGFALVMATLLFMLLAAAQADAMPIKPTVGQLLKQAEKPVPPFIPARAGWSSSSTEKATPELNVELTFDRAAEARAARSAVRLVALPDLRIVACLAALIFLLRRLRYGRQPAMQPHPQPA